jgi:Transposase DDE domain
MHPIEVLHKQLARCVPSIHRLRLKAILAAVEAVLSGAKVTITSLGRHIGNQALAKHKIKRMDRLVGNPRLHQERVDVYAAMARWLVGGISQPIILIDWSPLSGNQEQQLLRASIAAKGRALTLYEEIHSRRKLGNRKVQQSFLKTLKTLLPSDCHPIIVADSGFRVPFFRYLEKTLGWFWVGRIRNRDFIAWANTPDDWFRATSLYAQATTRPTRLGTVQWVRRKPLAAWLVLVRKGRKGRKRINQFGKPSRSNHSQKQAQREKEPWLLVASTSLQSLTPKQIMKLYQTRMQIEEAFRDSKSTLYGFGITSCNRILPQRRANLLLIAALAAFLLWCIGQAGKDLPGAKHVRVNSSSKRQPYSVIYLARLLLLHAKIRLSPTQIWHSLNTLKDYHAEILCA